MKGESLTSNTSFVSMCTRRLIYQCKIACASDRVLNSVKRSLTASSHGVAKGLTTLRGRRMERQKSKLASEATETEHIVHRSFAHLSKYEEKWTVANHEGALALLLYFQHAATKSIKGDPLWEYEDELRGGKPVRIAGAPRKFDLDAWYSKEDIKALLVHIACNKNLNEFYEARCLSCLYGRLYEARGWAVDRPAGSATATSATSATSAGGGGGDDVRSSTGGRLPKMPSDEAERFASMIVNIFGRECVATTELVVDEPSTAHLPSANGSSVRDVHGGGLSKEAQAATNARVALGQQAPRTREVTRAAAARAAAGAIDRSQRLGGRDRGVGRVSPTPPHQTQHATGAIADGLHLPTDARMEAAGREGKRGSRRRTSPRLPHQTPPGGCTLPPGVTRGCTLERSAVRTSLSRCRQASRRRLPRPAAARSCVGRRS